MQLFILVMALTQHFHFQILTPLTKLLNLLYDFLIFSQIYCKDFTISACYNPIRGEKPIAANSSDFIFGIASKYGTALYYDRDGSSMFNRSVFYFYFTAVNGFYQTYTIYTGDISSRYYCVTGYVSKNLSIGVCLDGECMSFPWATYPSNKILDAGLIVYAVFDSIYNILFLTELNLLW